MKGRRWRKRRERKQNETKPGRQAGEFTRGTERSESGGLVGA